MNQLYTVESLWEWRYHFFSIYKKTQYPDSKTLDNITVQSVR